MINFNEKPLKDMTFIDLFAGMGGFHIALESLGAECVYANEWDKHAQDTYEQNFNIRPDGDITLVNEGDIPDHDILCAGFPCQAFSISGNKQGFEDSRGTLFFDVARIVKYSRPKVVFLENVKNFASHDEGRTLQVVKSTMEGLGYSFYSQVLSATDYGIPTKRERIYMVCFRGDVDSSLFSFPKPFELVKHIEDFILTEAEDIPQEVPLSDVTITKEDSKYSSSPIRLGHVNEGRQGERIYSTKGAAITFSAYGGGKFARTGGYLIDGKVRKLHPRECARLMGYPDSHQLAKSTSQAYKQLGNSVVVDVLQHIGLSIAKTLHAENKD